LHLQDEEDTAMSRLNGKIALVTGATGAIGEAIVERFLEEGCNVMLVGRSAEKLHATASHLDGGKKVATSLADAIDEDATAASVWATVETFGGLDIMVANAGIEGAGVPIEAQTVEDFERVLRTNVVGVWLAIKHSIEAMKKQGGGSIVGLSSMAGVIGFPGFSPYVASKHAVYGLVKTAALEHGEAGIRVNAIGPGPIDNRMMHDVHEQLAPGNTEEMKAGIEQMIPMKRYGTNEEVANLALFLASDEASYCTGGMYLLDGGYTAA
jgi:NAD(P)-dependent dehydrogenase (short-subunit alcohol dehydrogenase family)